jgi:hypothetical protein
VTSCRSSLTRKALCLGADKFSLTFGLNTTLPLDDICDVRGSNSQQQNRQAGMQKHKDSQEGVQ